MANSLTQSLVLGLALFLPLPMARAQSRSLRRPAAFGPRAGPPAATPEVIVRFHDGISPARQLQILAAHGEPAASIGELPGAALVRVRSGDATTFIRTMRARADVLYAEPNGEAHLTDWDPTATPYAWNLFPRGAGSGRAISAFGTQTALAWPISRGRGVTVALLDSGVAYEEYGFYHQAPDLAATPFAPGWDFVQNDAHPNDDNGHGTHVAGILAARADAVIPGIAPEITLMPVKVMRFDGGGYYYDIARGIRYAADHGADILNLSLGGATPSTTLEEAVRYAASKGCILVAAAGNDGGPEVNYPARYPACIAVGATRFDGTRAPYSNRGDRLDLMAPGGDPTQDLNGDGRPDGIYAQSFNPLNPFNPYGSFYYAPAAGTSMAAPQVAGIAALVLAVDPALTASQVRAVLLTTAFHLGTLHRNRAYGCGLVDALAAVDFALDLRHPRLSPAPDPVTLPRLQPFALIQPLAPSQRD